MFIWNANILAKKLSRNEISEQHKFIYFLIFMILITVFLEISFYIKEEFLFVDFIFSSLNLILLIVSIFWCYFINKKGGNKDFTARYICLGVLISIETVLFSIIMFSLILSFIYAISVGFLEKYLFTDESHWFDLILFIPIYVFCYSRFVYCFRIIAKNNK